MASKVSGLVEYIKPGGSNATQHAIASTAYGYCETAASEQIKDVDMTGFILYEGVTVHIKFANINSADNPKLRINSSEAADAKPIVQHGTTAAGKTSETNGWYAGAVVSFTYDGTSWVRDQGFNSWRGIQDNLTSDSTTQSLSAAQGKELKRQIDLKTSNTGTVTKVSTGAGLTGGDITTSGTVKANLTSETKLTNAAADGTETSGRVYPVRLDKNGKLAVNVPWTNVNSAYLKTDGSNNMTGTLNIKPASGEGGEIHLHAVANTEAGIVLDHYGNSLRVFGIASADGTTKTGTGTPLVINPYDKTITGGYTLTGALTGNASTATSWANARKVYVALGTASKTTTINGGASDAAAIALGIDGTLGIGHGGTGATSANDAANALLSGLPTSWSATPTADTYFIRRDTSGTAAFGQVKFSSIANITNGKITLGPYSITPVTSVNGHTGSSVSVTAGDLGLSSALRFIGKTTSDMSESFTGVPAGITSYTNPIVGDVVLDKNSDAEYVCIAVTTANNTTTYTWELLGRSGSWATSTHTHGNITNGGLLGAASMAVVTDSSKKITTADLSVSDSNASTNATTTFVQAVTQSAQGKITVTKASLNTSGEWSGNAATATALTSNAGGWSNPIYFTNGKPAACGYINTHPENGPVVIPFTRGNDLAWCVARGGSVQVYETTSTDYTAPTLTQTAVRINNNDNLFDGTYNYVGYSISDNNAIVVIDITAPNTLKHALPAWIDFGSSNWGASQAIWYTRADTTSNFTLRGTTTTSKAHHALNLNNGSTGVKCIRIVLSGFTTTSPRIAEIGCNYYTSIGQRWTFMSRGIDDAVYRSITPAKDNTYNLGSSTAKWANVYATTFIGALTGNADTATTATNLANNPSIQTSGTTQITITAGGKTSSAYTVPYATSAGSVAWANTGHPDTFPPTIGTTATTAMAGNTTVTNVLQGTTTTSNWRKVILAGGDSQAAATTAVVEKTNQVYQAVGVAVQPSTGTLYATNMSAGTRITSGVYNSTPLVGTGTAAVDKGSGVSPRYIPAIWTFNSGRTATNGDIVTIKIPVAGHDWGIYMSIDNGAHYYPLVYNTSSRITTHFGVNTIITVMFDSSGSASSMYARAGQDDTTRITVSGGVWRVLTFYDSGNSNDTGTLIRDYGGNVAIVTTTAALYRYELMLSITDTNYGWKAVPINTTSNTQGTGKTTIYTGEFNPFGEIYYYAHTDTVNANTTVRADRIWKTYPVNIKYSFNCGDTLTASKDVYIVATMQSATTAKLRNPTATGDNAKATATGANAGPITQTLPTTNDGFIYIRLGRAYNSNTVDISIDHPIYYHDGTSIRRLSPINTIGTTKGDIMYWSAANIPKRLAIGTAGYFLKSTADGPAWEQKLPIANGGTGATTAAGARTNLGITAANVVGTGTTAQFYRGDNSWSNQLGITTLDSTAFINTLILFNNQGTESGTTSFDATKCSWGIGFKRQWNTGTTGAIHAGIYAYGISNWRAGLVFRVKTGTAAANAHDTTALYLNHDGSATFANTVNATTFVGTLSGNASSATKVAAKLATTTKTFLLGTSTTITATAANVDLIGDTGVYLTTTAGQLSAKSYSVNDGTNEKVHMQWNATDQSLDFIFN